MCVLTDRYLLFLPRNLPFHGKGPWQSLDAKHLWPAESGSLGYQGQRFAVSICWPPPTHVNKFPFPVMPYHVWTFGSLLCWLYKLHNYILDLQHVFSAHSIFCLDLGSFWLFMLTWTRKHACVCWRTGIYFFSPGIYLFTGKDLGNPWMQNIFGRLRVDLRGIKVSGSRSASAGLHRLMSISSHSPSCRIMCGLLEVYCVDYINYITISWIFSTCFLLIAFFAWI